MHDLALASVSYIFLYHIYTIPQPPTVESAYNAGDPGLIPGSGRSPGEGNGNPLQYSCLENPMDRGAWQATVHGVARVGHDLVTKPPLPVPLGFTGGSVVKICACQAGEVGSIPGQEDPLEKQMATHSSILVWRTPWTEETEGLQTIGIAQSWTQLSD